VKDQREGDSTRYRAWVAAKRRSQEPDVIARLADAGEDALRELVTLPKRILVGFVHRVEGELHRAADSVRGIDRLDRRVAELEKRVESLQKPATARGRSTRSSARRTKAQTAAPVEPVQADEEADRPGGESSPRGAAAEGERGASPGTEAETSA
jgi:hypothetical protein